MGKIEAILQFIVNNINLGTFFIAFLTFGITFSNFYRNRATIKVSQYPDSLSALIKPDFIDTKNPDFYWHNGYRLIADIIITNKSAKPISIIEFKLNKNLKFNSYSKPGTLYEITITPRKQKLGNGIIAYGKSESKLFPINDQWLQPIVEIQPFTSVRGHLFFHFPDKDMVKKERNILEVITSRKTFTTNLDVYEIHESPVLPSKEILEARDQNFS